MEETAATTSRKFTFPEYLQRAANLAQEAGVLDGMHKYFLLHQERLWLTASYFGIWEIRGKRTLEIGPFYGYLPFFMREQGNEVSVVEGMDSIVDPLKPLYAKRGIEFVMSDLSQKFSSQSRADHRLPFGDDQFDVICCWETMEHFNFNPVGFVRELRRVLKPGGKAFLTVPNHAALDKRLGLLLGRSISPPVSEYAERYEYAAGVYVGYHWREYCLAEFAELFRTQGFTVGSAQHLLIYQHHDQMTLARRMKRAFGIGACKLVPSFGKLCALVVRK